MNNKTGLSIVWDFLKHSIFLFLFVLLMTLPDGVMEFFDQKTLAQNDLKIALIQTCMSAIIIIFVYWRYQKQLKKNNPNHYGLKPINWKYILLVIIMYLISTGISEFLESLITVETAANQQMIEDLFTQLPIAMAISTVIVAPIVEELIFRGVFFNYFFNKNTLFFKVAAIVASGLLFGLVHEFALSFNLLQYALLGGIMAFIYSYTKDIRYNILFHVINNAVAVYTIFY